MRRGRIFFFLAFILILGLVAVLVVWQRVILPSQQIAAEATPTPIPVEIVIVSQNVPKGYILDEGVLTTIPWQESALAPGMIRGENIEEVYDRQIKYDLQAGTPLMDTMLIKEGEQIPTAGSPWALNIPPGMVAVSIPVNRLSLVSYAPRPGDHVNVIVSLLFVDVDTDFQSITPNNTGFVIASGPADPETGERDPLTAAVSSLLQGGYPDTSTGILSPPQPSSPGVYGRVVIDPVLGQAIYVVPSEKQRPRWVSQTLLQDVVVLQTGDFPLEEEELEPTPVPGAEPTPEAGQEAAPGPTKPDVITLIVRPQDAVTLNYVMVAQANVGAKLSLALRGANDNSRENILPVTLQFLLEQYQIPVPARLPYSLEPRTDDLNFPTLPNDVAPAP